MRKRRWNVQQINLKGWEPFFLAIPEALAIADLNVLAAVIYPTGLLLGMVSLSWMLKHRQDLFKKPGRVKQCAN